MKSWRAISAGCCSVFAGVLALTACEPPVPGDDAAEPTLTSRGAWTRTADSGGTAAVYFVLANSSDVADTLHGVSSDVALTTGMHMSMQHSGMMQMAPVRTLPVPADDSVSFRPLGAHVMLGGLRRSLREGDTVRVRLEFVSGRSIEVRADVRRP